MATLKHRNQLLSNQSIVNLEEIEEGNVIFCLTNHSACCRNAETGSGGVGFWYFPDGSEVPAFGGGFSRDRGPSSVALTYTSSPTPPPSGLYRCVIPDSNGESVILLAGVYGSHEGQH